VIIISSLETKRKRASPTHTHILLRSERRRQERADSYSHMFIGVVFSTVLLGCPVAGSARTPPAPTSCGGSARGHDARRGRRRRTRARRSRRRCVHRWRRPRAT
jgi:hypothetical protein